LRHLRAFGKAPTLVVGDLDSVKEEDLKWATENGAEIVHLPQQSESDLAKALNLCHQREWNDILVDGIEGGRHAHLLGGLAALASAHPSLNIRANLPSTKLTRFVTGFSDNITLSGTFSLFSFGSTNVTLLGPEWELNNDEVTFSTRGLSNQGNGESELTIHSGDPLFLLINL
jgi:thiamine pyrophosphokinase